MKVLTIVAENGSIRVKYKEDLVSIKTIKTRKFDWTSGDIWKTS